MIRANLLLIDQKGDAACRVPSQYVYQILVVRPLSFLTPTIWRHRKSANATNLRAPTRAPATPAAIARTVAGHDAAAEAARGSVAQIDDAGQGVRRMNGTSRRPLVVGRWPRTHRSIHLSV